MIRLYSTTYCPYAWSTRIVLLEKDIPFEVFDVDLKADQPEFLRVSPMRKVPVLVDGSTKVSESMVINEYLEERYDSPSLLGDTPEERAEVRTAILELNCTYYQPLAKLAAMLYYGGERKDDARIERQLKSWEEYLDSLDERFAGREWYALDHFTLADINLYTMVRVSQGFGIGIDGGNRKNLQAWLTRMESRDSVRRSEPAPVAEVAEQGH
jgi:RNA polymerase-associated protein